MAKQTAQAPHVYFTPVWVVVALCALARGVAAATIPLSGDEAYYWEWSRHLAWGYFDHPPMVGWLIALFSFGLKSVFLIRLPFVLCGIGAAVALFAFVNRATGNQTAAAASALLMSIAPFATIAFSVASPDGPYLLFWALSLLCALRSVECKHAGWWVALGAALAGCVLSRLLGIALLFAVTFVVTLAATRADAGERPKILRGIFLSTITFVLCLAPYLVWNATQSWAPFVFAIAGRHADVTGAGNIVGLLLLVCAALTPGIFIAALLSFARLGIRHTGISSIAMALVFTSSVPLLLLCLVLSLRERVEFYWMNGAFVSLVAAVGLWVPCVQRRVPAFVLVVVPAALLTTALFVIAAAPLQVYTATAKLFHAHLRNNGPFEIFSFQPAAEALAREARAERATVLTDGYGLSSVLDFYAGIPPIVIGYDLQGSETRKWFDPNSIRGTALFFDKEPLATRPDMRSHLQAACASVADRGARSYAIGAIPTRTFYVTRCEGLTPGKFAILLWRH